MVDDKVTTAHLRDRLEEVMLGHFKFLPRVLYVNVETMQGIQLVKAGLGSSMFNIAYGLPQDKNTVVSQIIPAVIHYYEEQPFAWWVGPSQRCHLVARSMIQAGLLQETTEHAMMHRFQQACAYDALGPLDIQEVRSRLQLDEMCQLLDPYDPTARMFYEKCEEHHLRGEEKLFIGRIHGTVCSMGILYQQGKTAGIFSVITAEPHQGNGYGHQMMRFLMKTAKEAGAQEIGLSASSEAGFKLYERLGFEKIGLFDCFEYIPHKNK